MVFFSLDSLQLKIISEEIYLIKLIIIEYLKKKADSKKCKCLTEINNCIVKWV